MKKNEIFYLIKQKPLEQVSLWITKTHFYGFLIQFLVEDLRSPIPRNSFGFCKSSRSFALFLPAHVKGKIVDFLLWKPRTAAMRTACLHARTHRHRTASRYEYAGHQAGIRIPAAIAGAKRSNLLSSVVACYKISRASLLSVLTDANKKRDHQQDIDFP